MDSILREMPHTRKRICTDEREGTFSRIRQVILAAGMGNILKNETERKCPFESDKNGEYKKEWKN